MDKGTWIAIAVMVLASVGVYMLQAGAGADTNAPTAQPGIPASINDAQGCQAAASAAAQSEQTAQGITASVVKTYFNQSSGQCYYELDLFVSAGNETDIRLAPNDQKVASCLTSTTDAVSCQAEDGSTITEPQFKALLAKYLPD